MNPRSRRGREKKRELPGRDDNAILAREKSLSLLRPVCRSTRCLEKRKKQTDHQLERKKYKTWQDAYGWEGRKIAHIQCVKKEESVKSATLYIGYNFYAYEP
jgi:hypothetical protein